MRVVWGAGRGQYDKAAVEGRSEGKSRLSTEGVRGKGSDHLITSPRPIALT